MEGLKRVACDPKCGFMIRSHDVKEIKNMVSSHAKQAHKMKMSDDQINGMIKNV